MKKLKNIVVLLLVAGIMLSLSACGVGGSNAELGLKGSDSSTNCAWNCEVVDGEETAKLADTRLEKSMTTFVFKGVQVGETQAEVHYTHKYEGYDTKFGIYDLKCVKGAGVFYTLHVWFEYSGATGTVKLIGGEDDDWGWDVSIADESVVYLKKTEYKKADSNVTKDNIAELDFIDELARCTVIDISSCEGVTNAETDVTFTATGSKTESYTFHFLVDENGSVHVSNV